ncbi:hypothetical protein Cpin_2678 [Chitinophaga pinensis DSM 2588]|uniref:Uncharacterized protein n=1 Tax=Chitinophaga pinensis (strain ATCC 43595 / DSM 2588 / LMG 13176 / NBRC 15968 / NCIMB 11800 / UQM 2034) TaxID=485918 RepID=A0A979G3I1_CHIPD|nr:hypothetical protein Cpin_2678 [Chitinophaga pinensis DSM 2588]
MLLSFNFDRTSAIQQIDPIGALNNESKLHIIFKPYLLLLIGLTTGYTFLHWLLIIRLELFQLKEGVTHFAIRAGLAAIAAWIYLRGRFSIANAAVIWP